MTDTVKIFDTTLRDGEQAPGCSMNIEEKVKIALALEKMNVDIIEAGFAASSEEDFKAVEAIAEAVSYPVIASLARLVKNDIDTAYKAIAKAKKKRLHLFIATSDIHMEHKLNMTKKQVIQQIADMVSYAKILCDDIEFSCEDASRSNMEFLSEAVNTAVRAGATVINLPDTVGYATPSEMREMFIYIRSRLPENSDNVEFSVHCHDDLGMATACSLAAVLGGARQIECTVNGIGERAGNTAMEEVVMAIHTRKEYFGVNTNINTKHIYRTSKLLTTITGMAVPPNKAVIGANAFAHESGIHQHGILKDAKTYEIMNPEDIGIPQNKMVLGKHSGRHALIERLNTLGYFVNEKETDRIFESFKELAEKKKSITDNDLEALVSHNSVLQNKKSVQYKRFVINSGNTITSTAVVTLEVDGEPKEKVAIGDGPVDACFKAIEKITKANVSLENYTIQSVTEGVDALGEVIVKVKYGEQIILGRGLSTDIIEASIKAYLNAINKIL